VRLDTGGEWGFEIRGGAGRGGSGERDQPGGVRDSGRGSPMGDPGEIVGRGGVRDPGGVRGESGRGTRRLGIQEPGGTRGSPGKLRSGDRRAWGSRGRPGTPQIRGGSCDSRFMELTLRDRKGPTAGRWEGVEAGFKFPGDPGEFRRGGRPRSGPRSGGIWGEPSEIPGGRGGNPDGPGGVGIRDPGGRPGGGFGTRGDCGQD
jgi:hypothetical protein